MNKFNKSIDVGRLGAQRAGGRNEMENFSLSLRKEKVWNEMEQGAANNKQTLNFFAAKSKEMEFVVDCGAGAETIQFINPQSIKLLLHQ